MWVCYKSTHALNMVLEISYFILTSYVTKIQSNVPLIKNNIDKIYCESQWMGIICHGDLWMGICHDELWMVIIAHDAQ